MSVPYSTSVLESGGWSTPRPGRFIPGKEMQNPMPDGGQFQNDTRKVQRQVTFL